MSKPTKIIEYYGEPGKNPVKELMEAGAEAERKKLLNDGARSAYQTLAKLCAAFDEAASAVRRLLVEVSEHGERLKSLEAEAYCGGCRCGGKKLGD